MQTIGGQIGVAGLTFRANEGSVAERATVADIDLSVGASGTRSQFNLHASVTINPCSVFVDTPVIDGWSPHTTGPIQQRFFRADTGLPTYSRWQIIGGDIFATTDEVFTSNFDPSGPTVIEIHMILFHKPLP